MTRPATTRVAVLAGVVVVLDQITKLIALGRLVERAPVHVIDGFLALTLVRNPGLKTWNNCPPNYTVQDGRCKPYTGR